MRELWMMRVVNQLLEIGEVISIGRDESEIERLIWGWEREARIIHRAPCNRWGACWRHLVDTIEWSVHGGNAILNVVLCCRRGAAAVDRRRPIWAYSVTHTVYRSSASLELSPIHASSRGSSTVHRRLQWTRRRSAASGETGSINVHPETDKSMNT